MFYLQREAPDASSIYGLRVAHLALQRRIILLGEHGEFGCKLILANVCATHPALASECRATVEHAVIVDDCTTGQHVSDVRRLLALTNGCPGLQLYPILRVRAGQVFVPKPNGLVPVQTRDEEHNTANRVKSTYHSSISVADK